MNKLIETRKNIDNSRIDVVSVKCLVCQEEVSNESYQKWSYCPFCGTYIEYIESVYEDGCPNEMA